MYRVHKSLTISTYMLENILILLPLMFANHRGIKVIFIHNYLLSTVQIVLGMGILHIACYPILTPPFLPILTEDDDGMAPHSISPLLTPINAKESG